MKYKVAIFTTSRAEFGIFYQLLRQLAMDEDTEPVLFVGGAHLALEYGKTIEEINNLDIHVSDTFDYLLNGDDSYSMAKSFAIANYELARIFENHKFDFTCILGDRFELLAVVSNSIVFKVPIIHIAGGDETEGSIDNQIRHMITKAAHLHFVSCEEYAENLRKMCETAQRIFNTGSLNIDNVVKHDRVSREELFEKLNLDVQKKTILMTYHPVTLEYSVSHIQQIKNVFEALESFDFQIMVTAPNVDVDRDQIIAVINANKIKNPNMHYVESLGFNQYHNLIPYCEFIIGNSSSGISEVPYFKVPSINVGDRQKGRILHESVIEADYSVVGIQAAIRRAILPDFRKGLTAMHFKFGDGHAAERMVKIIKDTKIDQDFMRKRLDIPS